MLEDKPYVKLKECHYQKKNKQICGSTDLCNHKGWPTLCRKHCDQM